MKTNWKYIRTNGGGRKTSRLVPKVPGADILVNAPPLFRDVTREQQRAAISNHGKSLIVSFQTGLVIHTRIIVRVLRNPAQRAVLQAGKQFVGLAVGVFIHQLVEHIVRDLVRQCLPREPAHRNDLRSGLIQRILVRPIGNHFKYQFPAVAHAVGNLPQIKFLEIIRTDENGIDDEDQHDKCDHHPAHIFIYTVDCIQKSIGKIADVI